jgi:hypothetical protein
MELFDLLPEDERIMTDMLRQIIISELPAHGREKLSFNVPFFYGHKGICIVWPATVPGGGIKRGVLLGFWQGYRLEDKGRYLVKGTNKKVYYRIFTSPEEIEVDEIVRLLKEAIRIDEGK